MRAIAVRIAFFVLLFCVVSPLWAAGNGHSPLVGKVRNYRVAKEKIPALLEEFSGKGLKASCGYDNEVECYNFLMKLKNETSKVVADFITALDGEEMRITTLYGKACGNFWDRLSADYGHSPEEVLACLMKSEDEVLKESKPSDVPTPSRLTRDELLALERQFHAVVEQHQFVVGISDTSDAEYSSSAFIGLHPRYRNIKFVITAGHVVGHFHIRKEKKFMLFRTEVAIPITYNFNVAEVLDLAVAEIPSALAKNLAAGMLSDTHDDLVSGKTPLAVVCNHHRFKVPVRVGFFQSIDATRGYLELRFPGIGVEDGCSGGPVIDLDGKIRGMVIRSFPSGQLAYAVPAETIVSYISKVSPH